MIVRLKCREFSVLCTVVCNQKHSSRNKSLSEGVSYIADSIFIFLNGIHIKSNRFMRGTRAPLYFISISQLFNFSISQFISSYKCNSHFQLFHFRVVSILAHTWHLRSVLFLSLQLRMS